MFLRQVVVGQIARMQQFVIAQDLFGGSGCSDLMVYAKHIDSRGNEFRDTQVMSSRHESLAGLVLLAYEVYEPGLASWVQTGRRLIQKPNLRLQAEDRCQSHFAFLTAGKPVGSAACQILDSQCPKREFHTFVSLLYGPVQAVAVQMPLPPKRREKRVARRHPEKPFQPGVEMQNLSPHRPALAQSEDCQMP